MDMPSIGKLLLGAGNAQADFGGLVTDPAQGLGVPFMLATAYNHLRSEAGETFAGVANLGKPLVSARCVQMLAEMLADRPVPRRPDSAA